MGTHRQPSPRLQEGHPKVSASHQISGLSQSEMLLIGSAGNLAPAPRQMMLLTGNLEAAAIGMRVIPVPACSNI